MQSFHYIVLININMVIDIVIDYDGWLSRVCKPRYI